MGTSTKRLAILSNSIVQTSGYFSQSIGSGDDQSPIITENGLLSYLCGKCNSILVKNVDRLNKPNNLVLHCSNCSNDNSLNKFIEYSGTPTLYSEVPTSIQNRPFELPRQSDGLNFYQNYSDSNYVSNDLSKLEKEIYSEWENHHKIVPGVLYQYTSFDGLKGMLQYNSIWMTDILHMNDSSEVKLCKDIIIDYIKAATGQYSEAYDGILRTLYLRITSINVNNGYYIACFCPDNNLLSQWRAYGNRGTGYNIGFESSKLANSQKVRLRKVIYDRNYQEDLVKNTIHSFCKLYENITAGMSDDQKLRNKSFYFIVSALLNILGEFMCTFKHTDFLEENEWRLIFDYKTVEHMGDLKFRQNNGLGIPYIELKGEEVDNTFTILPIVKITHGPALPSELTKKSLSLIMQQNGYGHAELDGSSTPLRL